MSICIRFLSVCLEMELLCHWVGLGSVLIDTVKQLSKVIIPVYTPNLNFKSVSYFQIFTYTWSYQFYCVIILVSV